MKCLLYVARIIECLSHRSTHTVCTKMKARKRLSDVMLNFEQMESISEGHR